MAEGLAEKPVPPVYVPSAWDVPLLVDPLWIEQDAFKHFLVMANGVAYMANMLWMWGIIQEVTMDRVNFLMNKDWQIIHRMQIMDDIFEEILRWSRCIPSRIAIVCTCLRSMNSPDLDAVIFRVEERLPK